MEWEKPSEILREFFINKITTLRVIYTTESCKLRQSAVFLVALFSMKKSKYL